MVEQGESVSVACVASMLTQGHSSASGFSGSVCQDKITSVWRFWIGSSANLIPWLLGEQQGIASQDTRAAFIGLAVDIFLASLCLATWGTIYSPHHSKLPTGPFVF